MMAVAVATEGGRGGVEDSLGMLSKFIDKQYIYPLIVWPLWKNYGANKFRFNINKMGKKLNRKMNTRPEPESERECGGERERE